MLPNVNIELGNGNIGSVTLSDDGISALLLTGQEIAGKLTLGRTYILASADDLKTQGITAENNPLVYKDVTAFYAKAGDGAELHLMVVSEASTLTQMCGTGIDSPLRKLLDSAAGRIRLVGVNRNAPAEYAPALKNGIDTDVVTALEAADSVAKSYMSKIAPVWVLLPAIGWDGSTDAIFAPREASYNCASITLASDGIFGESKLYSGAVGQIIGRVARSSVNISAARVKDGAIAATGYLIDGKSPQEHFAHWNLLHDAGYIFYRTFIGKNGYYLNDDATAIATTDDYYRISLLRVIQKGLVVAYKTYIDEILESIAVDAETGKLPLPMCKAYEQMLVRAINTNMEGEISGVTVNIDPSQNLIITNRLKVRCNIVPMGLLKNIDVDLSFNNPLNNPES